MDGCLGCFDKKFHPEKNRDILRLILTAVRDDQSVVVDRDSCIPRRDSPKIIPMVSKRKFSNIMKIFKISIFELLKINSFINYPNQIPME